jgi:nucleoside-diphosphate-sugar epimerase
MQSPISPAKHTLFITGGAGYIGAMLIDIFSRREDVERIIAIDKESLPEWIKDAPKLTYIVANTADSSWQAQVTAAKPDVVIHTAWQIREMYGNKPLQWKWNIEGSDKVFDFAFNTPSVKKLIYFSTVASYGAFPSNTLDHRYTEDESFRKTDYLYAEEKRISEEHLKEKYAAAKAKGSQVQVAIIRPAAITGPRGRYMRIRFGLQAALSGSLKGQKSFLYEIISLWVSWVPATPKWLRQYVHEDDITDVVSLFSFADLKSGYEAFNVSPPGGVVLSKDMAEAVGKRVLPIYPWMVRLAFFWVWHLTRGRIPTSPGSWKGYSYPIAVDGSKLTRMYGYRYKWQSKEAFIKKEGRYARYIPSV